jgi:hypothetical protein
MGRTKTAYRVDIGLDLGDAAEATFVAADKDRAVERAISDFSRFCPREKSIEVYTSWEVSDESFTSPKTTNLTAVVNAQSIDVAAGNFLTIAGQPDVPRPLRLTITDADDSTYEATFIITGIDGDGAVQIETLYFVKGMSKTIQGKKEFKYVGSVELDYDSGSHAGDTASLGYGLFTGVPVALANHPIEWHSETVTTSPAGTTYARGTDYTMDYTNGKITLIAGGRMATNTAYLISYDKSNIAFDLSSISDLIRIDRVERVGEVPQRFYSFHTFGKQLVIDGSEDESQENLSSQMQLAIHYYAVHTVGDANVGSSVPDFIDNTINMLGAAYCLFKESVKRNTQAVTDIASARTSLGSATTANTALGTALANIKKYLDNNTAVDAVGMMAALTADSNLRTAIQTALAATVTVLGLVTTNSLDKDTTGAEAYLDTGDDTINTVNLGGEGTDVSIAYTQYSSARVNIAGTRISQAIGYVQEATQRLSNLRAYIEQSGQYSTIASIFAREAEDRLAQIAQYISEAQRYNEAAYSELTVADRYRTEATERRNEVWNIWRDRKEYIGELSNSSNRQVRI